MNQARRMVEAWWVATGERFLGIAPGLHVVMPNHFHGVMIITGDDRPMAEKAAAAISVPRIVQWFKTMTTNGYIRGVTADGWTPFQGRLWQRNYYEHIIRNDAELERVCTYIERNPANWQGDEENPANLL